MKQICTQIAFFALLVIANASFAQSVSLNPANSGPALTTSIAVNGVTGFTSDNGTIGTFPKMQTTYLTTPAFHYNSDQTTIYFAYNFTKSQAGSTMDAPVMSILYGTNFSQTISLSPAAEYDFPDGNSTVYFSFTPGITILSGADFKIRISITLTNGDKALTANTLTTNAILTGVNGSSPLPVKFAGLSARKINSAVALTWNVGTEENVTGYEVQKSTDGVNFLKIGFVAASNQTSYNFTDTKVSEMAYYRIKSVDNDGKYAFSTVVSIKGEQSSVVMKAFPSPVQNQLTVQHSTVSNGKIEIASADGRIIKSVSLSSNEQQTSIELSSAKSGVYFVRLITANNIETLKIVKQ